MFNQLNNMIGTRAALADQFQNRRRGQYPQAVGTASSGYSAPTGSGLGPGVYPTNLFDSGIASSGYKAPSQPTSLFNMAKGQLSNPYRGTPQGLDVQNVKRDYINSLRENDRYMRRNRPQLQMGPWNTTGGGFADLFKGVQQGTGGIWDLGSLDSSTGRWTWGGR